MAAALSTITVSARIGAMVVHAAAARGVEPERLRELTGFDAAVAKDPDARIPLAVETQLWDEAARLTGDDAFGLHVASGIQPGVFDVLDYACRTAPTLRVSFERLMRYNRLEHDIAVFGYVDRGAIARLEHRFCIPGIEPSRHAAEFTIASIVVIGGQILGEPLRPRAAEFRHPAPRATTEHLRAFGVEPRFGCEVNALELDREVLERPGPSGQSAVRDGAAQGVAAEALDGIALAGLERGRRVHFPALHPRVQPVGPGFRGSAPKTLNMGSACSSAGSFHGLLATGRAARVATRSQSHRTCSAVGSGAATKAGAASGVAPGTYTPSRARVWKFR